MLTLWLVSGFYSLVGQQALRMLQFPFVRKKVKQFLISGLLMIRHLGNDILQVIPWVHIVCLAGGQQGTDYRHVNGSLVIAAEEIVLAPQSSKHSHADICMHYLNLPEAVYKTITEMHLKKSIAFP